MEGTLLPQAKTMWERLPRNSYYWTGIELKTQNS
jgi:hypothetical protein